ncbi:hypothetical protein [Nostoc parmelioides]|uniref:Uncharacterized protein n=1 Tax=Nostoc parmelioides FACHB-3921 TaxID=2692909 RepID=A0ABR8BGZ3_9NOSO|nr:hypothetical protein [Nostoc parmelioides]MBD2252964.1 hypothetical protein [Nostoc parmelioides FACHB-3921]
MGRWTPLILMAGGLAILMGTLLGINFPMDGQQKTASNNTSTSNNAPGGKASKVLPANINVNSSSANRNRTNATTNENRPSVAQDNFNTNTDPEERGTSNQEERRSTGNRTSVAQNNNSTDSSSPDNTSDTSTTEVQSRDTVSGDTNEAKEPIRALW